MSDSSGEFLHERSALQVLNLLSYRLTHQTTVFIVVYTEAVTFEREFQFRSWYSMKKPF